MYEMLFPTLSFPLNVYAQALYQQESELHYLHYGLWQEGFSLLQAQQAATEVLLNALPAAPQRLLEVGIGLGTTARHLSASGYAYIGITPDNHQILYCRHRLRDMPEMPYFLQTPFEYFQSQEKLQVIVFQESAQYIQPEILLRNALALLESGGKLVIMDEFSAPLCKTLEAGVYGFTRLHNEDFTQQAAPSITYLIQAIERQKAAVLYDLNIEEARLTGLMQSLRQRERAYREQQYFYKLLVLERQ